MTSFKQIEISKSSLLSLKSEILRKRQEVNSEQSKTKLRRNSKVFNIKTKSNLPEQQNPGVEQRITTDKNEDEDILLKSRRMLETKSLLYNKLKKGSSNFTAEEIEVNKCFLVQFDNKSSGSDYLSDEYDSENNYDEAWVEYVDCLGRTRKCLRKDLEIIKQNDKELSKSLDSSGKKMLKEEVKWVINSEAIKNINIEDKTMELATGVDCEKNELISNDVRTNLLRSEWEKQEEDLLDKKNVHYQDVLFNEARSHGVGYYAFSTNEEERFKQQEELKKLREETAQQQKSSLNKRDLREKQLTARLKSARNRKRARMGLPPEEDDHQITDTISKPEKEHKQQSLVEEELAEKAKNLIRSKLVRPWDIGKEGFKKHYECTQEEWVDKKRKKREKEFAPPSSYRTNFKFRSTISDVGNEEEASNYMFFTSKKSKNVKSDCKTIPSFKTSAIPTFKNKINSQIVDVDESAEVTNQFCNSFEEDNRKRGIEIPPPCTYSISNTMTASSSRSNNLEESILVGLKYLRYQAEKKNKQEKE